MSEKADVKSSRMQKGRKTINYLQKLKDEGTPIVQMPDRFRCTSTMRSCRKALQM